MLSMILEFRRVVGQRFEPPSHTHGRYDVRDKSNFCPQRSKRFSEVTSEVTFGASFVFGSGSGLG